MQKMHFIPHNIKDLEDILFHSILRGIQRVPTIRAGNEGIY